MNEALLHPIFVGHGSPMNVIEHNSYTEFLHHYGRQLPRPRAVLVISAHWQTHGTYITGNPYPHQIYDFYGFPEALYEVQYAPEGSEKIAEELASAGIDVKVDLRRGIDHAAWAVMKHLFPEADIPLLEISLDVDKSEEEHYQLGKKIRGNVASDILLIGSGNVVHNLYEINPEENALPFHWALAADRWIQEKMDTNDMTALIHYQEKLPQYQKPIPTNEHYLPLLYILGMKDGQTPVKVLHEGFQNGSVSMRCLEV